MANGLSVVVVVLLSSGCFVCNDGFINGVSIDGIYDAGLPTKILACNDHVSRENLLFTFDSDDYPTATMQARALILLAAIFFL